MSIPLSKEEFQLFSAFMQKECGIVLGEEKTYLIEHRLAPLLQELGFRSYSDFYFQAKHGSKGILRERIVDALTTAETMWFRDQWPFAFLGEKLLPRWADELKAGKREDIRIWSAACSTGQEPYSIKMAILEFAREHPAACSGIGKRVAILATDISTASLAKAREGRYCELQMGRGLPPSCRDRYFARMGDGFQLAEEVRAGIDFRQHNLQDGFEGFGRFDVVFLRNVAIYFSGEFKEELCARLAKALRPGGCLFLGATESLTVIRHGFEQVADGRTVYYRLKK